MSEKNVSERVKKIVAGIKEKTAMTAYQLKIIKDYEPDIFDSKFGGVPYWDMEKEYPVDEDGNPMMLLAQINFTKAALEEERLPKEGMLQFFISMKDELFGMDYEEPHVQKNFRIVFHENVDGTIKKEQVLSFKMPIAEDCDDSPVAKEVAVEIQKKTAYIGPDTYGFDEVFVQVVKERLGEEIQEGDYWDFLRSKERDYLYDELVNDGHWILGCPYFTQTDPREDMEESMAEYYDTLLFQMDTDEEEEYYVIWGDCGVANFFINSKALKEHDFSKVLYNWDCC